MAVRILSREARPFKDRQEAGLALAAELEYLGGKDSVVLGVPRGGMVIAAEISRVLGARLDVVLSHKIGAPGNPEFAIGAIAEDGSMFIDAANALATGADESYLQQTKAKELATIANRRQIYRKNYPKIPLKQKSVIITDDGLATGATLQAALACVRLERPKNITAAIPVASRESLQKISGYADEFLVLRLPEYFAAVGQFYLDFPQTSDEEVLAILSRFSGAS